MDPGLFPRLTDFFMHALPMLATADLRLLIFIAQEMKLSLMTTSADEFLRSLFSTLPGKLCAAAAALFLMVIVIVMQKRDTTRLGWSA